MHTRRPAGFTGQFGIKRADSRGHKTQEAPYTCNSSNKRELCSCPACPAVLTGTPIGHSTFLAGLDAWDRAWHRNCIGNLTSYGDGINMDEVDTLKKRDIVTQGPPPRTLFGGRASNLSVKTPTIRSGAMCKNCAPIMKVPSLFGNGGD